MLAGSALLTCAGNKREKAAQQVLSHCLPCKQPWPRYNETPESRAACHPRWQCRGFSCKYFSIAWLILWTGTNSSYARGWNTSLSNSVLYLLQLTFCLHTKLPLLLVNPLSSSEVLGSVYLPKTCRLYISKHWCKMLRHWNETVLAKKTFHFPMAYCTSITCNSYHCRLRFQTTKREQNVTILLLQGFLWKECSLDIPVHHHPQLLF